MCKIKITETGRSKKSRSQSFAAPHPTPLPPARPPPSSLPSAVVSIAPRATSQQSTEQEREAQEKIARDKCIQKVAVHHPKTIAHVPQSNPHPPNKIARVPHIYASTQKTIAQVKAPKKTQAQHKSIQRPVIQEGGKKKNAVSKSGKQENPTVAAPPSDGVGDGNSSGNKKDTPRRVKSTKQNRMPERVEATNLDRNESQTSPERNQRAGTNSPLRNVRFAIGQSRRTLSTTSSSSTSSEDSFIDPHFYNTHAKPNVVGKRSESLLSHPNLALSYIANMEENDSMESDNSSDIDAGDTFGSKMRWEDTESFRDPGPAKSQSHNIFGESSVRNGKTASSVPHAASHDHMRVLAQSPKRPSLQHMPVQEWETMSDQESAIDCGGTTQTPASEQDIHNLDWMQEQSDFENSGFNAWLKSLGTSQHGRDFSRTSSSPKSIEDPILVYQTKDKQSAKTEKGPLLAIKKSPRSDKSHHAYQDRHLQREVEKMQEPETKQATRNPSYTEEPVHYNPGLQIFWRDV